MAKPERDWLACGQAALAEIVKLTGEAVDLFNDSPSTVAFIRRLQGIAADALPATDVATLTDLMLRPRFVQRPEFKHTDTVGEYPDW